MATAYSTAQDADTPLARWRFSEASGTTFAEDVASVTATITGSVTPGSVAANRPGPGTGADFAGGGASVTGASAWRPQTIEALVTFDTIPSTSSSSRPWLFGHDGTTSTNPIPMIMGFNLNSSAQGRLGIGWWTGSAYRVVHATTLPPTGQILHVVGTCNDVSGDMSIFFNGTRVLLSSVFAARGTMTGVSSTAWIGRRFDGTAQIDGRIWDLALYSGELSAARVTAHYEASRLPDRLEVTGGGALGFAAEEDTTTAEWDLRGGGSVSFRVTPLDPLVPSVVRFVAHPNDPSATVSPWFIQEGFSEGTSFKQNDHSTWVYAPGGEIERVLGSVRTTRTDSGFLNLVSAADPTIRNPIEWGPSWRHAWQPDQVNFDARASVGAWPAAVRWSQNLFLAWQRTGADVTTAQDETVYWSNLTVIHKRYSYAGQVASAIPAITAREVLHDLMGRGLNSVVEYDPNQAQSGIRWSTLITHAAWWDGVSAREVLDFIGTYAPDVWWAVGAPGPSGLPRFSVGRWDAPARYVIPAGAGDVELSGGGNDVANRCLVRYIGSTFGSSKTTWVAEVRANVRGLAEAGIVRTMTLDLTSEGLMSPLLARVRGVSALRQAAQAKTAGRVVVSTSIYDRQAGRMVEPWEIEPGCTVIVCDAPLSHGRSTSLTESVGADGISVFRCTSVAYEISSNSATLSLDGGSRSLLGRVKVDGTRRRYGIDSPRL
jgi:hypothetical protein